MPTNIVVLSEKELSLVSGGKKAETTTSHGGGGGGGGKVSMQ
jgi:bacteriocin-like protein